MDKKAGKITKETVTGSPSSVVTHEKHATDRNSDAHKPLENASTGSGPPNGLAPPSLPETRPLPDGEVRSRNWNEEPLSGVMNYIVQKHHTYCRQQIAAIEPLLAEVLRKHGDRHAELKRIRSLFAKFSNELLMHLVKEESTLFPYITRMEEAVSRKEAFSRPSYGTVANPVRMMMMEHDVSSADFKQIREASNNYKVPPDASPNFSVVYQALEELERDLQVHSDLEDQVLFPRAIALEEVAESYARAAKTPPR